MGSSGVSLAESSESRTWAEFLCPTCEPRVCPSEGYHPDTAMDESDRNIISKLINDGRIPNAAIARQAGVSEETIRRHKASLMHDGLIRISAVLDAAKMGYKSEVLVAINSNPGNADEVADTLARLDEVTRVAIVTGRFDITAWITLPSLAELYTYLRDNVRSIPGVGGVTVFACLEVPKPWTAPRP